MCSTALELLPSAKRYRHLLRIREGAMDVRHGPSQSAVLSKVVEPHEWRWLAHRNLPLLREALTWGKERGLSIDQLEVALMVFLHPRLHRGVQLRTIADYFSELKRELRALRCPGDALSPGLFKRIATQVQPNKTAPANLSETVSLLRLLPPQTAALLAVLVLSSCRGTEALALQARDIDVLPAKKGEVVWKLYLRGKATTDAHATPKVLRWDPEQEHVQTHPFFLALWNHLLERKKKGMRGRLFSEKDKTRLMEATDKSWHINAWRHAGALEEEEEVRERTREMLVEEMVAERLRHKSRKSQRTYRTHR